jgi:hypothetical protein
MAKSFGQYQSGIEASTGNLVQASGQMANLTANAMAGFGQNIAQGLQQYNENSAKNDVLTSEAEQLGMQIQQFQAQFGDSPEHAPFAQSLQPYIEQLAKVPSMSLTQKMGAVTGVKAAFGNIGQQLQAFELMRKERLNRDFWNAKNTTPLTEKITDPVAIAKGQAPWSDRKTFDQNIADFRALAQSAVDNTGAAIDISKATELYKESIKRTIKTGRDVSGRPIAPETLAALQDQIAKAEGYQANEQTADDGVTDYAKEAELYDSLSMSAKQMIDAKAEAKAKAEGKTVPDPDTIEAWKAKKTTAEQAKDTLKGRAYNQTAFDAAKVAYSAQVAKDTELLQRQTADWDARTKDVKKEYESIPTQIDKLRSMQSRIPEEVPDDSPRGVKFGRTKLNPEWQKVDKQIQALRERQDELSSSYYNPPAKPVLPTREAPKVDDFKVEITQTPDLESNIRFYDKQAKDADKNISRLERQETAKKESANLERHIKELEAKIADGEALAPSDITKYQNNIKSAILGWMDGVQNVALPTAIRQLADQPITQESADRIVSELKSGVRGHASLTALTNIALAQEIPLARLGKTIWTKLGIIDEGRQLTQNEARYIENAIKQSTDFNATARVLKYGTDTEKVEALKKLKSEFDLELTAGKRNPTPAERTAMQAGKKPVAQDKEVLLGVDRNVVLGTKQREVQMSVAKQESAMAGYFQKKYGYVPAGFSEAFKANTPEANFKTMETPYGAFMWDGKGWSQIKMDTANPMSLKDAGEQAAYQFSNADGSPKQFANSGVYLSGQFQGTSTELAKFRTEYRSLAHAERSIQRLIEINEMTGESLSPTLKGEAKALLPAIKAALRTEIIGVGTVSNYEQELINDVVAGAADFWSLEASDRAKLAVILSRVQDSIADVPTIYGLTVHRQGQSKDIEGALRQRLLDSGNISNREQKWRAKNPDKQ